MTENQIASVEAWMEANSGLDGSQELGQIALDHLNSL